MSKKLWNILLLSVSLFSTMPKAYAASGSIEEAVEATALASVSTATAHAGLQHLRDSAKGSVLESLRQVDTLLSLMEHLPNETQAFILEQFDKTLGNYLDERATIPACCVQVEYSKTENYNAIKTFYNAYKEKLSASGKNLLEDKFLGRIRLKLHDHAMTLQDKNLFLELTEEF